MTDKEILEEIEYNVLNDPFTTFNQDSSYESVQIKATAIEELVKRFKKQQKEIEKLKEIDSLYKMMSAKDDKIEGLKEDYQILKDDIEEHRIVYVDTPEFEENYISKDKIKELREIDNIDLIQFELKELLGE